MSIAAEVRRTYVKDPKSVKLEDMQLVSKRRSRVDPAVVTKFAQQVWMLRLGMLDGNRDGT